ncbi:protein VAPYRIN-like [Aristolochia californica]|uniref:protein VAPYRIN-like n=1 Tax=Aristolochia californica TaxID=171875 RepID=UPI0035E2C1A1
MDRLIKLEPSNVVAIRVEPGQKCYGELTLRNVMYTMPVAFRLQAINKARYSVRPQSGIISPLCTLTVEITYLMPPGSTVPDSGPHSDDSFLLHSVVLPGAAVKEPSSTFDSVPNDWFTTKKKQVFIDSGIKIIFVGSPILAELVAQGAMDQVREVLERSDSSWRPADSVNSTGQTLLHIATARGRADLVQLLLEFEPNVEARNRAGRSPLEAAASAGEALIAELLLARRVSTERAPSSPWAALHFAAGGGHLEVMRLLLLKGANVNAQTNDGRTALHLAAEERRRDCARLLLASGAWTDVRDSTSGNTPLHVAAAGGDEQMVKLLLQKGANKDVRSRIGKSAYDLAAESGHSRLYDVLRLGDSLCVAARKGELRAVQRLLDTGASANGQDQHGWTPLHRACFKGRIDVVRALLEKGVDLDTRDDEGYTPLHCAVEAGQAEVAELLMKRGSDVNARTNKGITAVHIADTLHFSGIARILTQGGATREGSRWVTPPSTFQDGDVDLKKKKKKVIIKRGGVRRSSIDGTFPLACSS